MMARGTFVRVRDDHPDAARAGKDGMVRDFGDGWVALTFWFDRHNQGQRCVCVGPEYWLKSELDMNSVEV